MSKVDDLVKVLKESLRHDEAFSGVTWGMSHTLKILGQYKLYVSACVTLMDDYGLTDAMIRYAERYNLSEIDDDAITEVFDAVVFSRKMEDLIELLEDNEIANAFIAFVNKQL